MSKPSLPEIAAKAGLSAAPYGGVVNQIVSGLQSRRAWEVDHALGAIARRVGEDVLLSTIERNEELEALLVLTLNAVAASGLEAKRKVLCDVFVNAATSSEPIDTESLKVMTLAEIEAPHVRALVRLHQAETVDRASDRASCDDDTAFAGAVALEPLPVLTVLVRAGLVMSGMRETGEGTFSVPIASVAGVFGVSDYGRELLEELQDAGFPRA